MANILDCCGNTHVVQTQRFGMNICSCDFAVYFYEEIPILYYLEVIFLSFITPRSSATIESLYLRTTQGHYKGPISVRYHSLCNDISN